MKFISTGLKGAYIIELEPHKDDRGSFGRFFCTKEFENHGLNPQVIQSNYSSSTQKYTLRGMHYQISPKEETKLVQCVKGRIYDVIVDLRKDSITYKQWFGEELSENNHKMMYVPQGFAHGFLTLSDHSTIIYLVSAAYSPEHERGLLWNDPEIAIQWPAKPRVISEKDRLFPSLKEKQ